MPKMSDAVISLLQSGSMQQAHVIAQIQGMYGDLEAEDVVSLLYKMGMEGKIEATPNNMVRIKV